MLFKNINKLILIVYTILSFLYLFLIYFIQKTKSFLHQNKITPYYINNEHINFQIKHFDILLSYQHSFFDFLAIILKDNLSRKLGIHSNMIDVIFEQKIYLLVNNKIVNKIIQKSGYLIYDEYYNLYKNHHILSNEYINNEKYIQIEEIILLFDQKKIRYIQKYNLDEIGESFFHIIINQNSFEKLYKIEPKDIVYFHNICRYIKNFYQDYKQNYLYSDIFYKKKVIELNTIENDYTFKDNFKHLNNSLNELSQILIYQTNKKINKTLPIIFNNQYADRLKENTKRIYMEYTSQKKIKKNELICINQEPIYEKNFITNNFFLDKICFSFSSIAPFLEHKNFFLKNFILHEKINTIFETSNQAYQKEINFYSNIFNSFVIKIIVNKNMKNKSFFKLLYYFAQAKEYEIITLSLENIDNKSFKKVFDYYINILEKNKLYCIFISFPSKENIYYQNIIFKKYMDFFYRKNVYVKLYFVINNQEEINFISEEIIKMSQYHFYDGIHTIYDIKSFQEMLENYQKKLMTEKYNLSIITNFVISLKLNNFITEVKHIVNLYDILDEFEKYIKINHYKKDNISNDFFIREAVKLQKNALKNEDLINELLIIYNKNYSQIASLLGVHKSTISRYFKQKNKAKLN